MSNAQERILHTKQVKLELECKKRVARARKANFLLGRVLVVGFGTTGRALFEYCARQAFRIEELVILVEQELSSDDITTLQRLVDVFPHTLNYSCILAENAEVLDAQFDDERFDLAVMSPGIAPDKHLFRYAQTHASECIAEIEFAWRESDARIPWIAVTGTNGKTTTTALVQHLCASAGLQSLAVGNIGMPAISALVREDLDCLVLEASSFQLETCKDFAPNIAVMLNITPDHLSWHGSFEQYREAKAKLFAAMPEQEGMSCNSLNNKTEGDAYCLSLPSSRIESCLVFDANNQETRKLCLEHEDSLRQRGVELFAVGNPLSLQECSCVTPEVSSSSNLNSEAFCYDWGALGKWRAEDKTRPSWSASFEEGSLVLHTLAGTIDLLEARDLHIKGEHNVANALCAAACAFALGLSIQDIRRGLQSFNALPHRIEYAGEVGGVVCYNDSKATNVDATLQALQAFKPQKPWMLFGGRDKGTNLEDLVIQSQIFASGVCLYGESRARFAEAFKNVRIPCIEADTLEEAFDAALELAQPGDIICLSPACASFDEFNSFEERGTFFKDLVAMRYNRMPVLQQSEDD